MLTTKANGIWERDGCASVGNLKYALQEYVNKRHTWHDKIIIIFLHLDTQMDHNNTIATVTSTFIDRYQLQLHNYARNGENPWLTFIFAKHSPQHTTHTQTVLFSSSTCHAKWTTRRDERSDENSAGHADTWPFRNMRINCLEIFLSHIQRPNSMRHTNIIVLVRQHAAIRAAIDTSILVIMHARLPHSHAHTYARERERI